MIPFAFAGRAGTVVVIEVLEVVVVTVVVIVTINYCVGDAQGFSRTHILILGDSFTGLVAVEMVLA